MPRKVVINLSFDTLAKLMSVPDGIRIVSTRDREDALGHLTGEVQLLLEGDGLPERFSIIPGGAIRAVKPTISSGLDVDDWAEWEWPE
jgi:hypothetical protein